ncbi:hypothetical protein FN846DRAFT_887334 [Sphaerosporella brunnea]|uniref:Uncharacterized protein n=1 Tax=Sphaerosporella brunnea TaxID=1250544 RepID=A0A5J5F6D6_9PEZI|nr:hypothetical protein FN846DRAFT_887334 [Sphaerosporella brunnea]
MTAVNPNTQLQHALDDYSLAVQRGAQSDTATAENSTPPRSPSGAGTKGARSAEPRLQGLSARSAVLHQAETPRTLMATPPTTCASQPVTPASQTPQVRFNRPNVQVMDGPGKVSAIAPGPHGYWSSDLHLRQISGVHQPGDVPADPGRCGLARCGPDLCSPNQRIEDPWSERWRGCEGLADSDPLGRGGAIQWKPAGGEVRFPH